MLNVPADRARRYVEEGYWENVSFHGYLRRQAHSTPNRLAVIDSSCRVTWAELLERVTRTAAGFLALGVKPGDTVALQITNRVEFFDVRFALQRIGARVLTLASDLRDKDVARTLEISKSRVFVSPATYRGFDYCAMVGRLRDQLPLLQSHVVVERLSGRDEPSLAQWLEQPTEPGLLAVIPELPADEVDLLMLTSGTTGAPKLCGRTANVFSYRARTMNERIGLAGEDRLLSLAPITQGVGQLFGLACPLLAGSTVVLMDKFEAGAALEIIERERVTMLQGVPTHLLRMLNSPRLGDLDLSSLRLVVTGAAACPPAKQREIEAGFGCPTLNYYGMGEVGIPAIPRVEDPAWIRHETSGTLLAGMEARVIDDQGNNVAAGERGELLVRGPAASSGYVGDDEANARLFDAEGWAHSGDLGYLDSEGVLRIVGRKKDLIIRGGLNIVPKELEDLISTHPAIRQVAVIGIPDSELGERVCAVAAVRADHTMDLATLVGFLREQGITTYKLPERLEVYAELPLNAIGKVDVRTLKAQIAG